MPKADVTYNTIGFVGTVGTGATFTLYLDSEKTGAKTYHVYFKQLGGTGKLTLTTGVSGATNLTLNAGTYVAIIYVDENGNITNTASTPTDTIAVGNNQPATSSGVASAISNFNDWVVKTDANDCYYDLTTTDIRRTFFIARTGSSTTNHTPSTYRNWIIESYQSYFNTTAYILNQIAYGSNGEVYTRKAGHTSSQNQWNFESWEKVTTTADIVDSVTANNMQSVTSNAVAQALGNYANYITSGKQTSITNMLNALGLTDTYLQQAFNNFHNNMSSQNTGFVIASTSGGPQYCFLLYKLYNNYYNAELMSYAQAFGTSVIKYCCNNGEFYGVRIRY
jgi:hypothetical protein